MDVFLWASFFSFCSLVIRFFLVFYVKPIGNMIWLVLNAVLYYHFYFYGKSSFYFYDIWPEDDMINFKWSPILGTKLTERLRRKYMTTKTFSMVGTIYKLRKFKVSINKILSKFGKKIKGCFNFTTIIVKVDEILHHAYHISAITSIHLVWLINRYLFLNGTGSKFESIWPFYVSYKRSYCY